MAEVQSLSFRHVVEGGTMQAPTAAPNVQSVPAGQSLSPVQDGRQQPLSQTWLAQTRSFAHGCSVPHFTASGETQAELRQMSPEVQSPSVVQVPFGVVAAGLQAAIRITVARRSGEWRSRMGVASSRVRRQKSTPTVFRVGEGASSDAQSRHNRGVHSGSAHTRPRTIKAEHQGAS